MSDAQKVDPVKQHFEDGNLPRLDISMLPRDPQRVLGTLRSAVVASFNYCKQYPDKLDLFIDVLTYAVLFAKKFRTGDKIRREVVEVVEPLPEEPPKDATMDKVEDKIEVPKEEEKVNE